MKIKFNRIGEPYRFQAITDTGAITETDANKMMGGLGTAPSPMQMLLVGLGGCSGIDMVSILKKQQQDLKDIKIEINADREKVKTYTEFKTINVHVTLFGSLDVDKVEKALQLTFEKYCSVSKALEKTSTINYTYDIRPANAGSITRA